MEGHELEGPKPVVVAVFDCRDSFDTALTLRVLLMVLSSVYAIGWW